MACQVGGQRPVVGIWRAADAPWLLSGLEAGTPLRSTATSSGCILYDGTSGRYPHYMNAARHVNRSHLWSAHGKGVQLCIKGKQKQRG